MYAYYYGCDPLKMGKVAKNDQVCIFLLGRGGGWGGHYFAVLTSFSNLSTTLHATSN
jgi:hypothetical protein